MANKNKTRCCLMPQFADVKYLCLSLFSVLLLSLLLASCKPGGELVSPSQPDTVAIPRANAIELQWKEIVGAEYYNIYLSESPDVKKNGSSVLKSVSPTLTINNLENNKIYYFAVSAVSEAGESEIVQIVSSAPAALPLSPQKITITPGSESFTVDWAEIEGASQYNLYMARSPGISRENVRGLSGWMIQKNISKPFTQTGLINGQQYYIAITAENVSGESATSNELSVVPTQTLKVSMGKDHTCAIHSNLSLWCWGRNDSGQLGDGSFENRSSPISIGIENKWTDVSTSPAHTCALTDADELWCWGSNINNVIDSKLPEKINVPTKIKRATTKWKSISSGLNLNCGIPKDSEIKYECWGVKEYLPDIEQSKSVIPVNEELKKFYLSDSHNCVLSTNSNLWCWGKNNTGQLGNGEFREESSFFQHKMSKAMDTFGWVDISVFSDMQSNASNDKTCGLNTTGEAWCWGGADARYYDSASGLTSYSTQPTLIQDRSIWKSVAIGDKHICAIKINNSLWCSSTASYIKPTVTESSTASSLTQIGQDNLWSGVFSNNNSFCAVKFDGSLWCAGYDEYGELAQPVKKFYTEPKKIRGDITNFSISGDHVCATMYIHSYSSALSLNCWGEVYQSQSGNVDKTYVQTPVTITTIYSDSLSTASNNICYIGNGYGNDLICWGDFKYRQHDMPTVFNYGENWRNISQGEIIYCAVNYDGTLWCLDDFIVIEEKIKNNEIGEIYYYESLRQIGDKNDWRSVHLGQNHACALDFIGQLWCWGINNYGELGTKDNSNYSEPQKIRSEFLWNKLVVGNYHSCAIAANADLWCWGRNDFGQLGNDTFENQNAPVKVRSNLVWLNIAVSDSRTCGIASDSTLWCWGRDLPATKQDLKNNTVNNSSLPKQIGTNNDWQEVGIGSEFICAKNIEGEFFCWGDNTRGTFGDGKAWVDEIQLVKFPYSSVILK